MLPTAERQLAALPHHVQRQIKRHIDGLEDNPRPSGFKALKGGEKGLCRIRSGDYRIIYSIKDAPTYWVTIVRIVNRKDAYD
jgi:mRNA interferase RelE/StbE